MMNCYIIVSKHGCYCVKGTKNEGDTFLSASVYVRLQKPVRALYFLCGLFFFLIRTPDSGASSHCYGNGTCNYSTSHCFHNERLISPAGGVEGNCANHVYHDNFIHRYCRNICSFSLRSCYCFIPSLSHSIAPFSSLPSPHPPAKASSCPSPAAGA